MSTYSSHALARLVLYGLLWPVGVILLGLTSFRVHTTRAETGTHEPIVVELLVASILAILWVPVAIFLVVKNRIGDSIGRPRIHHEIIGAFILWVFFLVGAVDTTNRVLPGKNFCGGGKDCDVLTAVLAFAWLSWSILTVIGVLGWVNNVAIANAPTTAQTREVKA